MKAFVMPNFQKQDTQRILENLTEIAQRYGILLSGLTHRENQLFSAGGEYNVPLVPPEYEGLLADCDLIISIGGDGTIIHCARLGAAVGKPVMGINAGNLGFLAQVEPTRLEESMARLAAGDYNVEYRSAISAHFGKEAYQPITFALNDIVITKSPDCNIATLEMLCNGRAIDRYRADGLIFSTATGSTAYNLSAGGPVIDPLLDTITVVPICPHSISIRPLVFAQSRMITVRSPESPLMVIADGSQRRSIDADTEVQICIATLEAGFITFHREEFFEILTAKIKQRG